MKKPNNSYPIHGIIYISALADKDSLCVCKKMMKGKK